MEKVGLNLAQQPSDSSSGFGTLSRKKSISSDDADFQMAMNQAGLMNYSGIISPDQELQKVENVQYHQTMPESKPAIQQKQGGKLFVSSQTQEMTNTENNALDTLENLPSKEDVALKQNELFSKVLPPNLPSDHIQTQTQIQIQPQAETQTYQETTGDFRSNTLNSKKVLPKKERIEPEKVFASSGNISGIQISSQNQQELPKLEQDELKKTESVKHSPVRQTSEVEKQKFELNGIIQSPNDPFNKNLEQKLLSFPKLDPARVTQKTLEQSKIDLKTLAMPLLNIVDDNSSVKNQNNINEGIKHDEINYDENSQIVFSEGNRLSHYSKSPSVQNILPETAVWNQVSPSMGKQLNLQLDRQNQQSQLNSNQVISNHKIIENQKTNSLPLIKEEDGFELTDLTGKFSHGRLNSKISLNEHPEKILSSFEKSSKNFMKATQPEKIQKEQSFGVPAWVEQSSSVLMAKMEPNADSSANTKSEVTAQVVPGAMSKNRISTDSLFGMTTIIHQTSLKGGGEIYVRLKPENLGNLTLRVITEGSKVGLKIQAANDEAKKIIEESMQSLKESLSMQNLTLGQVDVSINNNLDSIKNNEQSMQSQNSNSSLGSFQEQQFQQSNQRNQQQPWMDRDSFENAIQRPRKVMASDLSGRMALGGPGARAGNASGGYSNMTRLDVIA